MKTASTPSPETRRAAMAEEVLRSRAHIGAPLPSPIERALRVVPRERFLPGLDLEQVYADQAVVTKRDADGIALSSVSAPTIVAMMLDHADLAEGMRVLEVGSGGYNAALLAELVGPTGQVTTIDIDPEVVARTRRCLQEAGYGDRIRTAVADGEHGFADHAPYDRILVTAGAWDIPPAWEEQLADGGRMVVPMRIRGLTRCLALERHNGHWVARRQDMCGFVRFQGEGAHWEPMPMLNEQEGTRVGLRLENGPNVDLAALRQALAEPPQRVWSDVLVGWGEPTDEMDVWLASVNDDFALLTADQGAVKTGLVTPTWILGTPAVIDTAGTSFAYRTLRRHPHLDKRWEFGAIGHGPAGEQVAERLCEQIRAWDRDQRHGSGPGIELYAAPIPDHELPSGRVVNKRHTRMVITWPTSREQKEQERKA